MRTFRPSLTVSILAFLCCLLVLTWLLFSLFALRTSANDLYSQKAQHARILLATFVNQLPETIPVYPEGLITAGSPSAIYAQNLADDPDFVRLSLLDANGKCIYTAGREGSDIYGPFSVKISSGAGSAVLGDGSGIALVSPVIRNGAVAGRAGLVLSLSAEKGRLERSRRLFLAYFAIDFFLLAGFGSFILMRIVVKPVNRLLHAIDRIIDGHYDQRVHVSGSAELVRLAESFNIMSETLQLKDQQVQTHVTALEKANADLHQAREETVASEKMASIGLLAAGTAHEIGTPLSAIMGYAELMTSENSSQAAMQDYAGRISKECARIDRIVRGLLDYSRPRSSEIKQVDIGRLVSETTELLTRQGVLKQTPLNAKLDDPLPCALTDEHQLQQVLINLLLNGRDALGDNGRLAIRVKADPAGLPGRSGGSIRIDVMDNGRGISAENLKKIFDPFYTTKSPGKGTGLGLAISSRIMDGIGGRISVQSKPGTGSCFTVWVPAA
ncbi:sensor histidine kinase [Pelotalea chapellei]|uniref:histidine kinase n=1 Tax=Pelotalea chapellei TaxID=44671 RepID=A0ABS5U5R5_9BACT|nr:ATP-binding protein [Pelotalea chapellei]MBT1071013.1 HAMP domain-containing protein [Pelotalea chapellei]